VLPVGEDEEQSNYDPEWYPLVSQIILISTPARLYLLDQVADSTLVVNKLRSIQKGEEEDSSIKPLEARGPQTSMGEF
jgi:hypothetical protein